MDEVFDGPGTEVPERVRVGRGLGEVDEQLNDVFDGLVGRPIELLPRPEPLLSL